MDEHAITGGDEAVARLADRRVEDWEQEVSRRAAEREAERQQVVDAWKDRVGELVTGSIESGSDEATA